MSSSSDDVDDEAFENFLASLKNTNHSPVQKFADFKEQSYRNNITNSSLSSVGSEELDRDVFSKLTGSSRVECVEAVPDSPRVVLSNIQTLSSSDEDEEAFENLVASLKSTKIQHEPFPTFVVEDSLVSTALPYSSKNNNKARAATIETTTFGDRSPDVFEENENVSPVSTSILTRSIVPSEPTHALLPISKSPPTCQRQSSSSSEETEAQVNEKSQPTRSFSSSSSSDDTNFEMFMSSLKTSRHVVSEKPNSKSLDSFIVDDDDLDELERTWTSCSEEGEEVDDDNDDEDGNDEEESCDSSTSGSLSDDNRRFFVQLQFEDEWRLERNILTKSAPRPKKDKTPTINQNLKLEKKLPFVSEIETPKQPKMLAAETPGNMTTKEIKKAVTTSKKLKERRVDEDAQFLNDMSAKDCEYVGTSNEAKKLRRAFAKARLDLANRVTEILNRRVFKGQMPLEAVTVEFTKRLLKTAGDTTTRGAIGNRSCVIRLAEKVCDSPGRLRDTLIHELCHAAVSMIDGVLHHHHGPLWVQWTREVAKAFSSLPPVTVRHRYSIQTKYTYQCQGCSHLYGRHSKSIDVSVKRCGLCYGILSLVAPGGSVIEENTMLTTPRTERPKNAWTTFVSENFGSVKREMPPKSAHKEVMARLKVMYQSERATRIVSDNNFGERPSVPCTPVTGLSIAVGSNVEARETEVDEKIDTILASSLNQTLHLN